MATQLCLRRIGLPIEVARAITHGGYIEPDFIKNRKALEEKLARRTVEFDIFSMRDKHRRLYTHMGICIYPKIPKHYGTLFISVDLTDGWVSCKYADMMSDTYTHSSTRFRMPGYES
jgi:hypothetical protein